MGTEHPIFVHERELGSVSEVTNMDYITEKTRDFLGIDGIQHAVSVKWLILNGIKYIREQSLIIANANETVPVFGLIKNIYVIVYCIVLNITFTIL